MEAPLSRIRGGGVFFVLWYNVEHVSQLQTFQNYVFRYGYRRFGRWRAASRTPLLRHEKNAFFSERVSIFMRCGAFLLPPLDTPRSSGGFFASRAFFSMPGCGLF